MAQQIDLNVVEERPLTIYLNAQEIVTAMTIGDYPEYLALGFLRNQGMLQDGEDILRVDYDEELETVVVRTSSKTTYRGQARQENPHQWMCRWHGLWRYDGGAGRR